MMTKEGSTKIVNFINPRGKVSYAGARPCSEMQYFFSSFFFSAWSCIRHIKYIVMMTMEGYTKILTLMTPWTKDPLLGYGVGAKGRGVNYV